MYNDLSLRFDTIFPRPGQSAVYRANFIFHEPHELRKTRTYCLGKRPVSLTCDSRKISSPYLARIINRLNQPKSNRKNNPEIDTLFKIDVAKMSFFKNSFKTYTIYRFKYDLFIGAIISRLIVRKN